MTRLGRFVVAVGSTTLAVLVTLVAELVVRELWPQGRSVRTVAGLFVFGITAAAFYTWCVDGPFIALRRRIRS